MKHKTNQIEQLSKLIKTKLHNKQLQDQTTILALDFETIDWIALMFCF